MTMRTRKFHKVKVMGPRAIPRSLQEFLLDKVPGAAAAYSLRLLRTKHSGGLVRGRAWDGSSDRGEADVVYDGNYEVSMNSPIENLDSTAQSRLGVPQGGGDKVLADLADINGSNPSNFDVFAPEWMDQSPNARHATNTTASEQPQLVSAGSLITLGGKPQISFDGSSQYLVAPYAANESTKSFTAFAVLRGFDDDDPSAIQGGRTHIYTGSYLGNNIGGSSTGTVSKFGVEHIHSFTWSLGTGDLKVYKNDSLDASNNTSPDRTATQLGIGATQSGGFHSKVDFQEIIYFESVKSNRSDIDNKINNFYGKY